ncbi:AMP-binding protein [Paludisphaera sp.]|uniref:AMP-binding protein n=1 Tax=Paludisphaera sp. TaxID=2017432 RepID=UPI00301DDDC4
MPATFAPARLTELEVVAVDAANSADYVAQVFRCYEEGSVVMIRPSGMAASEVPRGVRIKGSVSPAPSHGWHRFSHVPSDSDAPAHLCFTSGTTGAPKGILLSHAALSDVVRRLNDAMALGPDVREYVGVPVNYSFGFGRCRAVAAVGGACFLPEHGFNPLELVEMIGRGEVNAISAVPTQWRAFFRAPHLIGDAGREVRWIEIGSQWMSRPEKEQLKAMFPNAVIMQHYGLTEASRTTLLDISRASGAELEGVGRAVGMTEVDIAADGRIRIRGPHVGLGELRDGAIHPLVDEEGWLQTNDLGEIRDGALYYGGRADDLINCGGTKIPSEPFERALLQELGLAGGVAVGPAPDELRGEAVLVVVEEGCPQAQASVEAAARAVAARFGLGGAAGVLRFARCDEIPRTPTGKVRRRELAAIVEASPPPRVAAVPPAASPPAPAGAESDAVKDRIVSAWRSVLGMESVPTDKSFTDLGGDSLGMISVMIQIERLDIPREIARKVFEGKTIQQIVDEMEGRETSMSEGQLAAKLGGQVINTVRGALVLLVIAVHWLPGVVARIPGASAEVIDLLNPLFRLGTPGFALVFGMGWGYFQLPLYRSNPGRFMTVARRNAALLLGGILLLAAANAGAALLSPGDKRPDDLVVASVYSVLVYYLFAVIASPVLLLPAARSKAAVATFLLAAMAMLGCGILAKSVVDPTRGHGLVELGRLMLVARYNIFVMASTTFLGAALGAAFRQAADAATFSRLPLIRLGVAVAGLGLIASYQTAGLSAWMTATGQEPWALATYMGIIMIGSGFARMIHQSPRPPAFLRKPVEALSVIGILALPAFVLHGAVIPISRILRGVGAPGVLALALPLGAFLGVMALFYTRMRRLYTVGSGSAG